MPDDRFYGTGHRKTACARVWISRGAGEVSVNGQTLADFTGRKALEGMALEPLVATERLGHYDVIAKTRGGGISSQAGALRHGIARALALAEPDLRTILRRTGLLTRDPRVKERKKAGRHRARRAKQFSKR
ncbi:MAG: 30S ribosomal protein S9 [Armatimonadota bacterium]